MMKKKLVGGRRGFALFMLIVLVLLSACGASSKQQTGALGTGGKAVGFVFIGARDDYGYNQAAYAGSVAVEKAFPKLKVLRAENVTEGAELERIMEEMIRNGAKIIFPTSYGFLDPALNVAKKHPNVLFYHQGGLKTAENLGTYLGNIWESVYLSGVAAGKMSKTGKLGYVAGFPIPQVLLNVNAFTIGVRSVNPNATVSVVFTGNWCDPSMQASAANSFIDQGADVLMQHQNCTKTITEIAEKRGVMMTGYHVDAAELAPNGWITGAAWNWPDMYVDLVKTAVEGKFKGSKYDGQYRGGMDTDSTLLARYGKQVPEDVRKFVDQKKAELKAGKLHPYKGPVYDQQGKIVIADGAIPDIKTLESMNYLVQGVVGNIPANK